MPKSHTSFWITAFLIAAGVDVLFWRKPLGVSFPLWTLLAMGGALVLARREGQRPARATLGLGVIILGLAFLPFWRAEPFTQALSVLLTLVALMFWAATLRTGDWLRYTLWDDLRALAVLGFAAVTRPFQRPPADEDTATEPAGAAFWRRGGAILRGVALALPVVGVLALLFASADLVFAARLHATLNALRLERLPETLFRLFYVGVLTILFCGTLLHAVHPTLTVRPTPADKGILAPFLGWVETAIVLGSVNALFLFFVGLQFRYLFGGQANIHAAGFTYAEYARRGFGELVVVALISLGLILVLHTLGRRETPARQRGFTALSGLLIVLVLVILASAWQRLSLYEQAYGFTRLRTYAHLFIPWLGLALLVVLAFLLTHQMRRVAAAALLWGLGFGLLVGVWNVDAWVARQNVERAVSGQELDGDYLQTLSADAVPELIRQAQRPELPPAARAAVLIGLACRAAQTQPAPTPWPAFHLSQARAAQDLTRYAGLWQAYRVESDTEGRFVERDGVRHFCRGARGWD
jgi:hypothetical protein